MPRIPTRLSYPVEMSSTTSTYIKKYKGKKVICEMPCCTNYHPVSQQVYAEVPKPKPARLNYDPEDPEAGWIKVESRSKKARRRKSSRPPQPPPAHLYYTEDAEVSF